MKTTVIILILAVVLVGAGLLSRDRGPRDFDTTSRAYELYRRGDAELNAFKFAPAETLLDAALKEDPGFAMAATARAEMLLRQRRLAEARVAMARAESLTTLVGDEAERALVELRLAQLDGSSLAVRDSLLERAAVFHPGHLLVLVGRALLAEARGDQEAEEKAWREVLTHDSNYGNAYNALGYLMANQGRYKEALSYLKKYAYLAPGLANPHDSLGEVLSWIGRYEDAEQEFRKALELQPEFFYSLLSLGRISFEQGKLSKGTEILRKTRKQFGHTEIAPLVDRMLINALFSFDEFEALIPIMREYVRTYAEDGSAAYYRAILLALDGQQERAVALKDSLITALRQDAGYEASATVQRDVEIAGKRLEALFAHIEDDFAQEERIWSDLLEMNRDLPPHQRIQYVSRHGESLLRLGRAAEARADAEEVLRVNPRAIRPLLLLAESTLALGEPEAARRAVERLDAALRGADRSLPFVARLEQLKLKLGSQQNP